MTTIAQARAIAKQIRFEDNEELPNTDIFRKGADIIDALCVELEAARVWALNISTNYEDCPRPEHPHDTHHKHG